ncbi:MAG: GYD domain-containing protein [Acidimicrobiales bacterium]
MRIVHLVKYTPQALASLRRDGFEARERWAAEQFAALGGAVVAFNWTATGEWHAINVAEVPSLEAAFDMAQQVGASGGVERSEVVIAMTSADADRAANAQPWKSYRAPGTS